MSGAACSIGCRLICSFATCPHSEAHRDHECFANDTGGLPLIDTETGTGRELGRAQRAPARPSHPAPASAPPVPPARLFRSWFRPPA